MNLIKKICLTIEYEKFHLWQDVFLYAVYCIEKYQYKDFSDPRWPATIKNLDISAHDFSQLKNTLITFIKKAKASEQMVSCIWALGKYADPNLKELFINLLRDHLQSDPNILYQTIIALQNIGEKIGTHSSSILEVEKNRQSALKYLKEKKIMVNGELNS